MEKIRTHWLGHLWWILNGRKSDFVQCADVLDLFNLNCCCQLKKGHKGKHYFQIGWG